MLSPAVAFVFSTGLTFLAALAGSYASIVAKDFYAGLNRPAWAPPAWLFGPVWTILYVRIAVAGGLALQRPGSDLAAAAFVNQLFWNGLWSWSFFRWRRGAFAVGNVLLLWGAILANVLLFWPLNPVAGALLIPYLFWVTFASALNISVVRRNREQMA